MNMAKLTAKQEKVRAMFFDVGMTHEEIARQTGQCRSAVTRMLIRVRKILGLPMRLYLRSVPPLSLSSERAKREDSRLSA